jgi:putative chitinase
MLTSDDLHSIMPGLPAAKSAAFLPPLDAAMTEFAIDAPPRAAAFLAQLAHESGQLRLMEEIWGPDRNSLRTASSLAPLGNTQAGDGKCASKAAAPSRSRAEPTPSAWHLLGVDPMTTPEQAALPDPRSGLRVCTGRRKV